MPALPTPGSSENTWGQELNDFLEVAHTTTGEVAIDLIPESSTRVFVSPSQKSSIVSGALTSSNFVYGEVPSGSINSSNTAFTLANTPLTNKYVIFINGVRRTRTTDYSISGTTVTFTFAPTTGDEILIDYIK